MKLRLLHILILLAVIASLAAGPALSKEEEPEREITHDNNLEYRFSLGYASRYIWRGLDLNDGYPVMQPNMELIFGESGHSFGLFGYYGLQGTRQYDEIDYIWTYSHPLSRNFSYTLNVAYYDVFFGDRYAEAYGTLSWDDCPFHPVLSYYKELRHEGTDYLNLSLSHDFRFCRIPFSFTVAEGYGQGPLMENPGFSDLAMTLSTSLGSNDRFSLNSQVSYNLTPSDPCLSSNHLIWYSMMAKITF